MICCGSCKHFKAGAGAPPGVSKGGLYPFKPAPGENGAERAARYLACGWCSTRLAQMAAHTIGCGMYRHRPPAKKRKGAPGDGANESQ